MVFLCRKIMAFRIDFNAELDLNGILIDGTFDNANFPPALYAGIQPLDFEALLNGPPLSPRAVSPPHLSEYASSSSPPSSYLSSEGLHGAVSQRTHQQSLIWDFMYQSPGRIFDIGHIVKGSGLTPLQVRSSLQTLRKRGSLGIEDLPNSERSGQYCFLKDHIYHGTTEELQKIDPNVQLGYSSPRSRKKLVQ